jgi:hypothetical protein
MFEIEIPDSFDQGGVVSIPLGMSITMPFSCHSQAKAKECAKFKARGAEAAHLVDQRVNKESPTVVECSALRNSVRHRDLLIMRENLHIPSV